MKTLLALFIIWILLAASFAFAFEISANVIELEGQFGYRGHNNLVIIDGG